MDLYAVCIPEMRTSNGYYEPPEQGMPCSIFAAETPAQAKRDALRAWTQRNIGVYSDDWTALRVRKVGAHVAVERGELPISSPLWRLWPEGWPVL